MFKLLTNYLLEQKILAVPRIGVFEISPRDAKVDMASSTIQAPDWDLHFRADNNPVEALQNSHLYDWLAGRLQTNRDEAHLRFDRFAQDLEDRLMNGQDVNWPELGLLQNQDGNLVLLAEKEERSPFTAVAAQKVMREGVSHASLVGDRETTTQAMREQLAQHPTSGSGNRWLKWVLLGLALAAAAWYFSANGCSKTAGGNRQKAEVQESPATYQLK